MLGFISVKRPERIGKKEFTDIKRQTTRNNLHSSISKEYEQLKLSLEPIIVLGQYFSSRTQSYLQVEHECMALI